jgi:polyhydroxyalkanoate synthesis regulator protein
MSSIDSRKYKELDSRIQTIEKWLDEKNEMLTQMDMVSNYSFLIKALKEYVDRQEQMGQQMQHMQGQFQTNIASVEEFMKDNKLEKKWEKFLETKQKEAEEEAKKAQAMDEGPDIKSASEIIAEQRGMGRPE